MKITARANANIALVKYWGKRDEKLVLPCNGSISMTLDNLFSVTTVDFAKKYDRDVFFLEGKKLSYSKDKRLFDFINTARAMAGSNLRAKIVSENNFPTSAGLASSASGFAALATALNKALALNLKPKELSMLARLGSGSATRSVLGGFVEWKKGKRENGSDSFAEQIVGPDYWKDFKMIVCITSKDEKEMSSRDAMRSSVKTSSFYEEWLRTVEKDLANVRKGIKKRDFELVAKTAEKNCLKMHAVIMTSWPPLIYWNSRTVDVIKSLVNWRGQGLNCYFTIDAGPQIKIMCLKEYVPALVRKCKKLSAVKKVIVSGSGERSEIINKHLF